MAGVIHRQIELTPEEDTQRRRRAAALAVCGEDVIVSAVRQRLAANAPPPRSPDTRAAWEEIASLMRAHAALHVLGQEIGERGWSREDAYDERFDRCSH